MRTARRIAMFSSTLKLFSQVPCPDENCARSPCLFSHNAQHRTAQPQPNTASNYSSVASAAPASRAAGAKPSNLFIQRNARPTRPSTSSRTPDSANGSRGQQPATPITAFDMARGLTAQSSNPTSSAGSRGPGTPSSASPSTGQSRPPVLVQTKTLASGMIQRPNKVSRPSTVCTW